ncbi:MAG: transcriptional regulator, LuxR family protein [Cyanobacteria bacterium RYN_339]|nr:transcriptional regulator, LuxR family protein [Cyanobacteria bacterium RYN_339]
MSPPILRRKLQPPPAWPDLVRRERLLARLDEAVAAGQHVALVAGSGYGKTALLADWARGRAVGWLTLDAEDADLDAFLGYMIAACEAAVPGFRTAASGMLGHAREREGALAALAALIADLDEQVEAPVALVLDDWHLPASPSLDALLGRLLSYLPATVRVLLATRQAPEVKLAELRAKRQLVVLEEAELAFDAAELKLLRPDATLAATGGWPAGMGLAPDQLDAYLDEVVLAELSADDRAVLARLALVDTFDLGFAREVLGVELAPAAREGLQRRRLLLPGLAVSPPVRRSLRRRFLAEAGRAEGAALLERIATRQWEDGAVLTALATWMEAGAGAIAASQLAGVAERWLDEGRLEALGKGLALVGSPEPHLELAKGELWRRWGDFDQAERALLNAAQDPTLAPRAGLRRALAHASRGEIERAKGLLDEVRDHLTGPDALDVMNLEGGLALLSGDAAAAIAHYDAALALARSRGATAAAARALHNLGVCYTRLGDYARALASYDAGLAAGPADGPPVIWMTPINRALALAYLERPAEAVAAATAALDLVRRYQLAREEGYALRILGYAHLREARLEAAEECFEAAEALAKRTDDRLGLAFTRNFQAEAASLAGDHAGALARLAEVEAVLAGRAELAGLPEFAHTRAKVLVAAGRLTEARPVIDALLERARKGGYRKLQQDVEGLLGAAPAPRLRATGPLPPLNLPDLAIRCFGGLRVWRLGQEMQEKQWQSFRAKLLLAYLLHSPEGATKDRLMEVLFPNERTTEAAVNMTLMRLRKALEPGLDKGQLSRWVPLSAGSYVFNRQAPIQLDTADFDRALRAARQAEPVEEKRLLDAALACYRGPFLPEFDQDWVVTLRLRFRDRALAAARRRLELEDDALIAEELIHRALEIDPLADEFHRELILRFIEAEEPQRAREHYQLCERRYRDALGTPPPADLAALLEGL